MNIEEIRKASKLLDKAMGIIEIADHRASASDGPVSHVRDEMSDAEWRQLYVALTKASKILVSSLPKGASSNAE